MYVKIPYELYQEIKNREGVEKIDLFEEYLKEEIVYSLDALDIIDDKNREKLAKRAFEKFRFYDGNNLTEDLYWYLNDQLDKE